MDALRFDRRASYLYLEKTRVEASRNGLSFNHEGRQVMFPAAKIALLMLGPGVSITSAAVQALAENECLCCWVGQEGVRFYASGRGSSSAEGVLQQARLFADPKLRNAVARKMFMLRFGVALDEGLGLPEIRGKEGILMRDLYRKLAAQFGVEWTDRDPLRPGDAANNAISAANACLYGISHAAIHSIGLSPAIGFVHEGDCRSFVFDVADLYKAELALPIAFEEAALGFESVERRVRYRMRQAFASGKMLRRIVADVQWLMDLAPSPALKISVM